MMVYAVDFDGTLCEDKWPEIGEPNMWLIRFLKARQSKGDKVILNTLREEDDLAKALEWCYEYGLLFDAVNDNLPELKEKWGNNPRKISADYYIDDRNLEPLNNFSFIPAKRDEELCKWWRLMLGQIVHILRR